MATRSLALGLCLAVILVLSVGGPALAVNSVVVESKTVQVGTKDVQIGIFLTNDLPMRNLVIPLTLRSVSGGAFITKIAVKRTAAGRLSGFLTGINVTNGYYNVPDSLNGCYFFIGHSKSHYRGFWKIAWSDTLSHADSVSIPPSAVMYSRGKLMPSEARLAAGADGSIPSLYLLVDIGASPGQFEIDTCCTGPASNHLVFVVDSSRAPFTDTSFTTVSRIPSFPKGVITVVCTKPLPVPIGPIPADAANDQPDSVTLKWNPVIDSCADPVTYDVLFGADCVGLDPVLVCTGTNADSCAVADLSPNTSYFWKIVVKGTGGRQTSGPCWSFKTGTGSAVQYLGGDGVPRDYSLDQSYPNPFNASTVIKFNTKHDGHVRLDVYNILGQKVKTLVDEFRHYGPQAVDWDGTDVSGQAVPTGLYFYRLVTNDFSDVKKMVLLK